MRMHASSFDVRLHAEQFGWVLERPVDVWIQGSRLTQEEVIVNKNETFPRTLFEPKGHREFTFSVPVMLIRPEGLRARWFYLWQEAGIAGVTLLAGDEPSRFILPIPEDTLQEV